MSGQRDIDEQIDALLSMRADDRRLAWINELGGRDRLAVADGLVTRAFACQRNAPGQSAALARLGIHAAAGNARARTRGQAALAQAHVLLGEFRHALDCAQAALSDPSCDHDSATSLDLHGVRVQALVHLERYEAAHAAGEAMLRRCETIGDRGRAVWARSNLADLAFRHDAPREALDHYFAIDRLLPPDAPATLRAAIASNRANALEATNRFRAAERHFEIAERAFAEAGSAHTVAQVVYNAAYAASLRGRYAEALRRYATVETEFEAMGDLRHRAHIDLDRAEIHLHLGMPREAREMATRAQSQFECLELQKERAQAFVLIGRAAELLAEPDAARRAYGKAETIFHDLQLLEREIACTVQQARVALESGDPSGAQGTLDRARTRLPEAANPLSRALVAFLQGRIYLQADRPRDALEAVEGGLYATRRVEAPWVQLEGEWIRAQAHTALGDLDEAVRAYHAAIGTLERFRVGVPPDEYMTAFLAERASLYEEIVSLLVRRNDVQGAFEFCERAKSRSLVDLLAARRTDEDQRPLAEEALTRLRHLRERLNAIYRRLNRQDGSEARSARTLRQARAEADRMEAEVARIARRGRLREREMASLEAVDAPDLAAVQADLEEDTTLIEYFLAGDELFVFSVTRDEARVVRRAVSAEKIRHWMQRFQFHLSKYERGDVRNPELALRATRANLQELADALLGDLDAPTTSRLVLVPHGLLHHVPFHALPWGDGWVADEFKLTYAPSAAVYGFCRRTPGNSLPEASILGLPDDVAPEIAREARDLAVQLGGARVFLGEQATYACLRDEALRARVLHVATHGMFRRSQPMMSSIRLADRWVNLYDLYDLQVESDLVVLSTCESGIAAVSDGNEILGLTRGFLYAGAPALLTSQWRVNDAATADFMHHFYERLCASGDAEEAMQHAMRRVRETRPHPYHWAPFFLLGRPRALELGGATAGSAVQQFSTSAVAMSAAAVR